MGSDDPIVILGGGPAGGAVAIGLARMGYPVTLVTSRRALDTIEGISERTLAGLRNAGFHTALDAVAEPSPRRVTWNGETSQANTERLVNRRALDQGIRLDLMRRGVRVLDGRVLRVEGLRVTVEDQQLTARFLVEARGRSAPLGQAARLRGIETLSLPQLWHGPPMPPGSAVQSFEDGWVWLAADSDGTRYAQLTLDVSTAELPARNDLPGFCRDRLLRLDAAREFLDGAEPSGTVGARTSTPVLCQDAVGPDWIRVGDAAMAVDPLSGNGIFQSLSSALIAPSVINTLLREPGSANLARRFYQDRLDHLFLRFARTGRDFYRMERRWADRPFWAARQGWPDDVPAHHPPNPTSVRVEKRPVVCDGTIQEREVVVTDDQPLGIWHVNGVELAPIVQALREKGKL